MHRLVEPVEEPPLDLVSQPGPIGRPEGTLFGDQHIVGLLDALPDGVPVDAGAIEPAQVDHLGVDVTKLCDSLKDVVNHREVCDHGDL